LHSNSKFYYPFGIALDIDGNIIVAEFGNHRIRKINCTGKYVVFVVILTGCSITF